MITRGLDKRNLSWDRGMYRFWHVLAPSIDRLCLIIEYWILRLNCFFKFLFQNVRTRNSNWVWYYWNLKQKYCGTLQLVKSDLVVVPKYTNYPLNIHLSQECDILTYIHIHITRTIQRHFCLESFYFRSQTKQPYAFDIKKSHA